MFPTNIATFISFEWRSFLNMARDVIIFTNIFLAFTNILHQFVFFTHKAQSVRLIRSILEQTNDGAVLSPQTCFYAKRWVIRKREPPFLIFSRNTFREGIHVRNESCEEHLSMYGEGSHNHLAFLYYISVNQLYRKCYKLPWRTLSSCFSD